MTMPRRNADDIELRCLLAGRVRRRGTAVLHLADTCRQGEPAFSQSAPTPLTNVVDGGAGCCARTSTRKTPAEQQNSSPTEGAKIQKKSNITMFNTMRNRSYLNYYMDHWTVINTSWREFRVLMTYSDTIQYDTAYLTCSKKLTCSPDSL